MAIAGPACRQRDLFRQALCEPVWKSPTNDDLFWGDIRPRGGTASTAVMETLEDLISICLLFSLTVSTRVQTDTHAIYPRDRANVLHSRIRLNWLK
jgi:hypothetical protein